MSRRNALNIKWPLIFNKKDYAKNEQWYDIPILLMGFIHLCGAQWGKWPGLASFVFIGFIDLLLEPTQFLSTQSGSLLLSLWCDKTKWKHKNFKTFSNNSRESLIFSIKHFYFKNYIMYKAMSVWVSHNIIKSRNPQTKPQNQGTGAVTRIPLATHPTTTTHTHTRLTIRWCP